jgi:hypothetical protein
MNVNNSRDHGAELAGASKSVVASELCLRRGTRWRR